jgi:hypothetical protein
MDCLAGDCMSGDILDDVPWVRKAHRFIKRSAFEPLPDMGINSDMPQIGGI